MSFLLLELKAGIKNEFRTNATLYSVFIISLFFFSFPVKAQNSAVDQALPDYSFIVPDYSLRTDSYSVEQVPDPKAGNANGFISDPDNYISEKDEQLINNILYSIEQNSSAQVAVVFLRSIGDEVPKQFATELFNYWGIGGSEMDNGLLILTVMDQRRTEIEVGYGLEGIFTDLVTYRILQSEVVPNFKDGNYGLGIVAASNRIKSILDDPAAVSEIYDDSFGTNYEDNSGIEIFKIFLILYVILCTLITLFYVVSLWLIDHSKEDFYDKYKQLEKFKAHDCLIALFPIPIAIFYRFIIKRLKKYRNTPRYSQVNGKKMELLNELTENSFLKVAQIIEEEIDSIQYDVWVTEDKDDILILDYAGDNSRLYEKCTKCGYKTFGRTNTKVIRTATYDRSGLRRVYYKCKNCHFEEMKEQVIPKKVRSNSSSSGSSFSSSSSGSGSWGGGSSGGGGSGASW